MKNLILITIVIAFLTACGSNISAQAETPDTQLFDATFNGITIEIDGEGSTLEDQQKYALSFSTRVMQNESYQQLLSDKGIDITLKCQKTGEVIYVNARLMQNGLSLILLSQSSSNLVAK